MYDVTGREKVLSLGDGMAVQPSSGLPATIHVEWFRRGTSKTAQGYRLRLPRPQHHITGTPIIRPVGLYHRKERPEPGEK